LNKKSELRERKKISSRKAILDGGLEVFATIGYERSTIADIAKASGRSVGSLYNHCGDKYSIYGSLVSQFLVELRDVLNHTRENAASLEAFVMGAFCACSELLAKQSKMQKLINNSATTFRQFINSEETFIGIVNDLERDLQKAVDAGIMPSLPVKLMTIAMMSTSLDFFSNDIDDNGPQAKAEFLGQLFLGGIERFSMLK